MNQINYVMKTFKTFRDNFLFAITMHRGFLPAIAVLLVITSIFWVLLSNGYNFNGSDVNSWWLLWGDPIIGLSTFFVAVIIWLLNTAKYWEEHLELKLTVIYTDSNKREVICIKNAFLAHVGDIRNWGQTLGRQAVGKGKDGKDLYFKLSNLIEMKKSKINKTDNSYFKHYTVVFKFTELPKASDLEGNKDMANGKFVWEEGHEKAVFIEDNNDNKSCLDEN